MKRNKQNKNITNKKDTDSQNESAILVDFNNNINLRQYGVAFHWWDSIPTSLHYHNHYEIFIITSGMINHYINGKSSNIGINTLYMIKPEDIHKIAPYDKSRNIHINLAFTEDKLQEICHAINIDLYEFTKNTLQTITITNLELAFFLSKAEEINYEINSEHSIEFVNIVIVQMIINAISLLLRPATMKEKAYPEWFSKLLAQMHSPEFVGKNVHDIYELSNYSPPALINYFKKYLDETIVSYFTKIKMNFACSLFATTSLTTLEVSSRLGYDSLSHFNKLFKNYTSITPTQYKQSINTLK